MTIYPYDPTHPAQQQSDGVWRVTVGYAIQPPLEGASVIVICDLKGTRGAPELVRWAAKDI